MLMAAQPSSGRAKRRTQKPVSGLNCLFAVQLGNLQPRKGIAASGESDSPHPACSPCLGQGGQGTAEEMGSAANSPVTQLGTCAIKLQGKAPPWPLLPAQTYA